MERYCETTQIERCLANLKQGDVSARDALLEHACGRLRLLARHMLGSFPRLQRWEETDDVLNLALMRLHRALAEVHPDSARGFFALAGTQIRRQLIELARGYYGPMGIGANHATDSLLSDRHKPSLCDRPDDTFDPASLAEWTEFHEHVEALPDAEREVFDFLWYEQLKPREVACLLEVSEKTVQRRWRSACLAIYRAMRGQSPES